MEGKQNHSVDEEDIMTDADFERAMQALQEEGNEEVNELLMAMSENRIISWDEAERILGETSNEPVKSSLPQQTRPTEPDNDTDVEYSTSRLAQNDPKVVEINLNNMKRTPVPKIKRLIEAIRDNEHLEKLSLANMGLYDMDLQPLIDVLEHNTTLRCVNLETNYLSGDFFARLFKAALNNQSLEEVKAVNQGVAFSTQTEREIIEAITANRGLTKVSINLRLPEGRFKVEQATIRNQEIRRILRRQMLAEQKEKEEKAKPPAPTKKVPGAPKASEDKEEKKAPLKRQPSGAAAELAKQRTASNLAIAGVNTPKPSTSEEASKPTAAGADKKQTAVRERARADEERAKKPYEAENTAERAILAEKSKQKMATGRWPPAGGAQKSAEPAEQPAIKGEPKKKPAAKKEPLKDGKEQQNKEPPKGPSWRDRLAKKEEEPPAERKGSLALRDKFEAKGKVASKDEEEPQKVKPSAKGTGEKLAATRGKFEQKASIDGTTTTTKPKTTPKARANAVEKQKSEDKPADGEEKPAVKKRVPLKKKQSTEKSESPEKSKSPSKSPEKKTAPKEAPATAPEVKTKPTSGFTPSWRERLNK